MNPRPMRGWMVLFILVTGLSAALLASRKSWPDSLSPWRDWLSAHAAPPRAQPAAPPREPAIRTAQRQDSAQQEVPASDSAVPAPTGAAQVGTAQVGTAQVGTAQVGTAQGGTAQVGAAQERPERHVEAGRFEYPADESGRLLQERLTPPQRVPVEAFPFVDKPRQPRKVVAEELTHHLKLPSVDAGHGSTVLPDERRSIVRAVPALDNPPLAFEPDPSRPARPTWQRSQLAYASAPDPEHVQPLQPLGQPLVERPAVQDDPTVEAGRGALLAAVAVAQPVLPPPLRLTIPDPHEIQRVVHLANPPADEDPAAQQYQKPETPVLPVAEPKKPQKK